MTLPRWLLIIISGCAPLPVAAQVVISEIAAFERTDHEWVEIYNTGGTAADLTDWKFWENDTNHGLNTQQGDLTIAPGEYAIIAQKGDVFLADHLGFAGTVIDSSWGTLRESGEEIGLKDAGGTFIERFTYLPAAATSLERINLLMADYTAANWLPHPSGSTPGLPNSGGAGAAAPPTPPTDNAPAEPAAAPEPPPAPPTAPDPPPPPPPQFSRQVVINELLADPGSGGDEWVELYNTGRLPAKLDGWKLMEGSGAKRSLSNELAAGGFLIVEPTGNLNNRGDRVILLDDGNVVVNEVSFGDWDDGARTDNAPSGDTGQSVARLSDGVNSGNPAVDFRVTSTPTPGSPNRITPSVPPPPPPSPPPSTPTPTPAAAAAPPPAPTPTGVRMLSGGAATSLRLVPEGTPLSAEEAELTVLSLPLPAATPTPRPPTTRSPKPKRAAKPGRVLGTTRTTSIAEARLAPPDTALTVVGTVLVAPGVLGRQYFYLADESGGLQIYQHESDFPQLSVGDTVEVSGTTSRVGNEPRLKADDAAAIKPISTGEPPAPKPIAIAALTATSSGTLVQLSGEITEASGRTFVFDDGSGEITIALWRDAAAADLPLPGARGAVTGILVPANDTVRLRPRGLDDLALTLPPAATAPPANTPPAAWYLGATAVAAGLGMTGWLSFRRRSRLPPAP